jgi:outer membrane protein OmpA-like peptidoglycan-associated protein
MKIGTMVGLALCLAAPAAGWAQGDKLLRGKDITESALIDALTPAEPEIRTRSIKILREDAGGGAKSLPPPKPASASLLITFETKSAELTPRSRQSLDVVARALKSDKLTEFKFSIEGHADPRGGDDLNLRLSQSRAESVVNYLAEQHGIDRERLKPVGKGTTELLNATRPDAPENRRVTIKTLVE